MDYNLDIGVWNDRLRIEYDFCSVEDHPSALVPPLDVVNQGPEVLLPWYYHKFDLIKMNWRPEWPLIHQCKKSFSFSIRVDSRILESLYLPFMARYMPYTRK